jgi:hypothetical protein
MNGAGSIDDTTAHIATLVRQFMDDLGHDI